MRFEPLPAPSGMLHERPIDPPEGSWGELWHRSDRLPFEAQVGLSDGLHVAYFDSLDEARDWMRSLLGEAERVKREHAMRDAASLVSAALDRLASLKTGHDERIDAAMRRLDEAMAVLSTEAAPPDDSCESADDRNERSVN